MKKILMRAAKSPLDNQSPYHVIAHNTIGNNIGNLLFPHSISRTLMVEETEIETINFSRVSGEPKKLKELAAKINRKYDLLVLPFANAFRLSFMGELKRITAIVKRLTIPCVVVGVGMQAKLGKSLDNKELNQVVTDFVKAVLGKSSILGLRGDYTAEYLIKLGFVAEQDFTVIGCPSMYLYGKDLPRPHINGLTPESTISINSKISLPQKFHDFIYRCRKDVRDYYYIPQVIEEIRKMYVGMPFPETFAPRIPAHFPVTMSHPTYVQDKARTFINVKSWLEFLSQRDFSLGSRIHGNIAAVLAGAPAFVVVSDERIKELVEYHHIQHIMLDELEKGAHIFELYQKADFNQVLQGHEKRFLHYLDFLAKNGLETIYDKNGEPGRVYFDEALEQIDFYPGLHPFAAVSPSEQGKRLDKFWKGMAG